MTTIKRKILLLEDKLDKLQLRERVLCLVLLVVAIYMVWDFVIYTPVMAKVNQNKTAISRTENEITRLQKENAQLLIRIKAASNSKLSKRYKSLQQRSAYLKELIAQYNVNDQGPKQLSILLGNIINESTDLKLEKIENAEQALLPKSRPDSPHNGKILDVYGYSIRMVLRGNFFSTLDFLRKMEDLPWAIYWDEINYQVSKYPMAKVTIQIHTLTADQT